MVLGEVNKKYEYSELEIEDKEGEVGIYSLLVGNYRGLVWVGGECAYIDSICIDYNRGKEIYILVYRYDSIKTVDGEVRYNNRLEKVVIHSWDNGFEVGEIVIQPDISINKAYRYRVCDIVFKGDGGEEARDIFMRYIGYSYGYHPSEVEVNKYKRVQASKMYKYQRRVIKERGLQFYGKYIDEEYRGVRLWGLRELVGRFSGEDLLIGEAYGYRRLRFELELYIRLYKKDYWVNWSSGDIEGLEGGRYEYIKYKERGIYLIMKRDWIKKGDGEGE